MNQYLQALRLVKIRTIAIVTSLGLIASTLLAIVFSQSSHALILDKLLPQTTQTLTGVVNQVLTPSPPRLPVMPPRAPAANPQPTPQSSSPVVSQTPAATPPAATSTAPSATAASPQQAAAVPLLESQLQPIDFLPANYSIRKNSNKVAANFAIVSSPRSSLLLLEPTDQGWQFLGVVWYWWGAIAAEVVALVVFWKRKGEQLSYQLLSWRSMTYAE